MQITNVRRRAYEILGVGMGVSYPTKSGPGPRGGSAVRERSIGLEPTLIDIELKGSLSEFICQTIGITLEAPPRFADHLHNTTHRHGPKPVGRLCILPPS